MRVDYLGQGGWEPMHKILKMDLNIMLQEKNDYTFFMYHPALSESYQNQMSSNIFH